jgi:hypothetical protein
MSFLCSPPIKNVVRERVKDTCKTEKAVDPVQITPISSTPQRYFPEKTLLITGLEGSGGNTFTLCRCRVTSRARGSEQKQAIL